MILVVKKQLKHAVANKAQKNSEASTVINNNLGLEHFSDDTTNRALKSDWLLAIMLWKHFVIAAVI